MRTLTELDRAVRMMNRDIKGYRLAVAGLIFLPDGRVLLEKRGGDTVDEAGALEGVGGGLGNQEDLHEALQQEIMSELHNDEGPRCLEVTIDEFLDFEFFVFTPTDGRNAPEWIVVSYLCRLRSGKPRIAEPGKVAELKYLTLDDLCTWPAQGDPANVPPEQRREHLSPWTVHVRTVYQQRFGRTPYWEASVR